MYTLFMKYFHLYVWDLISLEIWRNVSALWNEFEGKKNLEIKKKILFSGLTSNVRNPQSHTDQGSAWLEWCSCSFIFHLKLTVLEHNVCNSLKWRDAQTLHTLVGYSRVKQT